MALWHYTVNLSWVGPGSPGVNVWDIRTDTPDIGGNLQEAVDAIGAFYASLVLDAIYPIGYVATGGTEAVEINTSEISPVDGFSSGEQAGVARHSGVAQMIATIRTTSATRRGRGRKFIGPVSTDTMDGDGTPSAVAVADLQSACTALVNSSLGAGGWAIGVYSSVDELFRDATQMQARNYFAALRSRRD